MKRISVLLLVIILSFGFISPVYSTAFDDIPDWETANAVTLLQNLGIITGFPDGTYRPDENFTRAQYCTMIVLFSGITDYTAYEGFTIFPDVRGDHWARGYVNAAVRSLGIVTGFPDGTFRPDIPISYAQAVTALVRLLGYTDADVGLNWPHSYLVKANQMGLTNGINLGENDNISRGQSARMFYNAVFAHGKDGTRYCDTLGFTEQHVIVLSSDGISPDGVTRGLVTIGGAGFYPCRSILPIEDGAQGTLLIDKDGYALSWTPDRQTVREITIRSIGPMSVIGTDGSRVDNIPSSAKVFINGELRTWDSCWIDIAPGLTLRIFFTASGAVDYMILYQPTVEGDAMIVESDPAPGRNPLPALGIDAGAVVYKNGIMASWADIRGGDVLIYDAASNTVTATDFRITGIYESAFPSREAPDEVTTLGGKNFRLLPDVRPKLAARRIGEALTFVFTPDGRVADIRSAETPAFQPGIVTGDRSVTLTGGMMLSGIEPLAREFGAGTPVLVCMSRPDLLNVQVIPATGSATLDMVNMKAGSASIASYAVVYDLSGTGGRAVRVDMVSLPDAVDAAHVLSVRLDSAGRANLIVLRNVTGDALYYGFTTVERGRFEVIDDGENSSVTLLPDLVHIDTYLSRLTFNDYRSLCRNSGDNVYGVAINTYGDVIASQPCFRVNNIRRTDFSGNTAVTVSGVLCPIPGDLEVYVQATGRYIPVAEARLYSNNFSVFLDKPAADGGRPRFIVAL